MAVRSWSELSRRDKLAIAVVAPIEVALTIVAAADLARRPRSRVRGPKAAWWPVLLVQPFGPPAYLIWGRRSR
ncbi:PLD nuclease N-terminal domain-containing protein [Actinoplanes sp. GCM10030250]|uniref:PLD nuclease N-terminal domain-containing protein n=1 Tax=Actinoplanes sp. GCM10030250 TaxID=3273376 RepID=UPI003610F4FB